MRHNVLRVVKGAVCTLHHGGGGHCLVVFVMENCKAMLETQNGLNLFNYSESYESFSDLDSNDFLHLNSTNSDEANEEGNSMFFLVVFDNELLELVANFLNQGKKNLEVAKLHCMDRNSLFRQSNAIGFGGVYYTMKLEVLANIILTCVLMAQGACN